MYRKIVGMLLVVLIIIGCTATAFSAVAIQAGEYEYELTEEGTAVITGYFGTADELAIPATVDGYSVTGIGESAFAQNTQLKTVSIPESVVEIGWFAFNGCTEIEYAALPKGLKMIGNFSFSGCNKLATIDEPEALQNLGDFAFSDTLWLNSKQDGFVYFSNYIYTYKGELDESGCLVLDASYDEVACSAFSLREDMKSVVLPPTMGYISWYSFFGTGLKTVAFPQGLKGIGGFAFSDCKDLSSVVIPDSVQVIMPGAFYNCPSMKSVYIPQSVTVIETEAFGYYFDASADEVATNDEFIIVGHKGTAAENYAHDNGFIFVDASLIKLGDANGDLAVNVKDATLIQKFAASLVTLNDNQMRLANVNGDSSVNVKDATAIQKYAASIQTEYKIGESVFS